MTIASQIDLLNTTKTAIKTAIENKGVTVGTAPFSDYPAKITAIEGGGAMSNDWVRPADWLPLPELQGTDCAFHGLFAVFENANNVVSVYVEPTTAGETFMIDWGDGVIEGPLTLGRKDHTYDYSTISNSTLCSRGYKQAIISVTPHETASGTFKIGLDQLNPNQQAAYNCVPFLDIIYASNNGGSTANFTLSDARPLTMLERFRWVGTNNQSHFASFFKFCNSLQHVELYITGKPVNSMFNGCRSLRKIPDLDYSQSANVAGLFENCSGLPGEVNVSFPASSSVASLFAGCTGITKATVAANGSALFSSIFNGCFALEEATLSGVGNGSWASAFTNCYSLKKLTLPPTSQPVGANALSNAFSNPMNLSLIPAIDLSLVTGTSNSFAGGGAISTHGAIRRSLAYGATVSHSYRYNLLSREALVEIFNNLGTAAGTQTITISNNPGSTLLTTEDRAIATSKGWTISG